MRNKNWKIQDEVNAKMKSANSEQIHLQKSVRVSIVICRRKMLTFYSNRGYYLSGYYLCYLSGYYLSYLRQSSVDLYLSM